MNMKDKFNWGKADEWIRNNQHVAYSEFINAFPKFPFTDATFYNHKTKILHPGLKGIAKETATRSYRTLYETLITIPRVDITDNELKGMKRMNEILRKHAKTKFDIIQVVAEDNTTQIEIRQTQAR